MNSLLKILAKYQYHGLFDHKSVSDKVKKLLKEPAIKVQFKKIKTPLIYYQANLMKQGLINKKILEDDFEQIRKQNMQLWDTLIYEEKDKIAKLDGQSIRRQIPTFQFNHQTIVIPFFDLRLNHYYYEEMAIFDYKQYFKLYHDFHKQMIDISFYKGAPYTGLNPGCISLVNDERGYVLWDATHQIMTVVNHSVVSFKLFSVNSALNLKMLATLFLAEDVPATIRFLLENNLVKKRVTRKLKRRLKHAIK